MMATRAGRGFFATVTALGTLAFIGAAPASADTAVPCSATALVSAVSAVAGPDGPGGTLDLASGCKYVLTSAAYTPNYLDQGADGLPQIFQNLTINGNGATITRASGAPPFRIFEMTNTGSLTLRDLTISNGLLVVPVSYQLVPTCCFTLGAADSGGAIEDSYGTPLSITNTTFSGNKADSAGAILARGPAFSVDHSRFLDNTAQVDAGAILTYDVPTSPSLSTISASRFEGNIAGDFGGAIESADTSLSINSSTFDHNAVGSLGAAPNLTNSTPGVEVDPYGGGAIADFSAADVTVSDSTFTGNTAAGSGGAIYGQTESTSGTTFTVTTSTIDGNTAGIAGGGIALANGIGHGLHVSSSIVANNKALTGRNCTTVIDDGYNLDSGTSCGFSAGNHSLSNTNPGLGPLAPNGGPTETMALQPGSPAIDQIPSATTDPATGASVCQGTTDQRGVTRPQGPACDIGAYELIP